MTKAAFWRRDGAIQGFSLEGHCGGRAGSDIVCAAVSSAAYLTANTVTDVYGCAAEVAVRDGLLTLRLSPEDSARCQPILVGFYRHMQELETQYPRRITLEITEV